ncbi:hypothetical protein MOQ_008921 [Trypanosoma cruzi marinkellei]|uniref:Uncharacterized protein n=1 Tax=Trypanosoma cruzi marinkellei TaxID=85056 RepID=K2LXG6_TRYCR|nr:hypothetical protein MOQ_008921 [Trypanosoma cruzi marinkellei]
MKKPVPTTESSRSLEGVSSILCMANKCGSTDMMERYRNQLVDRVLALTSSIIERISTALNTDVMSKATPRIGQYKDTNNIISGRSLDYGKRIFVSDRIYDNRNGKLHRVGRPTRERALTLPAIYTTLPEVKAPMNMSTTSVLTINISDCRSKLDVTSSELPVFISLNKFPMERKASRTKERNSLSEVMCLTGEREMGPLFVRCKPLTDEQVRVTLSLLKHGGNNVKGRQQIQRPYYELLRVCSYEMMDSMSPLSSPCLIEQEGKQVPVGCFTRAVYAHHSTDNEPTETAALNVRKLIREEDQGRMHGTASSQSPLKRKDSKTNSVKSKYGKSGKLGSRSVSSLNLKSTPKTTKAVGVNVANNSEDQEYVAPIVWRPFTPLMDNINGSKWTQPMGIASSQTKYNEKNICIDENNVGEDDVCIYGDVEAQFGLRGRERIYTLRYVTPLLRKRRETNVENSMRYGVVPVIRICVNPPVTP